MNPLIFIPNLLTTANIFCGFLSLLFTLQGNYAMAAWMILTAGLFDLCDGRLARLLRVSSPFGENYDTLSDCISFGIAPALLLQRMLPNLSDGASVAVAFLYLLAVTFRLARFGIPCPVSPGTPKAYFAGLASPPAAATLAAFVLFVQSGALAGRVPATTAFATLALVLAGLMVSQISFPSFKAMAWRSPQGVAVLATASACIGLMILKPEIYIFGVGIFFITVSLLFALARRRPGTPRRALPRG